MKRRSISVEGDHNIILFRIILIIIETLSLFGDRKKEGVRVTMFEEIVVVEVKSF